LRQQEIVADYALLALRAEAHERLCREACRNAALGLDAHYAKVLEYQPETNEFSFEAAVGWDAAIASCARLGSGPRSPAGHAFRTGMPVVCGENQCTDGEDGPFRLPRLLREQGIRSAIVVPICEADQIEPYGVLEVDSTDPDAFTSHDVAFLRALANILAAALETLRRTAALRRSEAFAAAVLDACPDCVEVLDNSGAITRINVNGLHLLDLDLPATRLGLRWAEQWPAEDSLRAAGALERARLGGIGRFAAYRPNRNGVPRWWDVLVAPMPTGDFVVVSRDATAQVLTTTAKDRALHDKDLMMLEVHHRVKNSLQLVQNLLSLQARASTDDSSATQLGESAARVRTIAAIHDRLYRSGATLDVEVGPYLEGLIEDLQAALAGSEVERCITLQADPVSWPASDVPTLGLVLTELVTNSMKYGSGRVSVTFLHPPDDRAMLIVEDEGPGPDPDFDPGRSRGLGMRLVTGLLRGEGAGLEIDRKAGHARFVARLPFRN
jgi:two-component sensor histidine kinase